MDIDNPFDKKMDLYKNKIPTATADALIYVVDTLDMCIAAAEALFKKAATPEHALAIYDRMVQERERPKQTGSDLPSK